MELNRLSTPISPRAQNGPIVKSQAVPEPPEGELEAVTFGKEGSGKARGVVSKLNEGGHFKGVADIRLRIAHFDNPELEPIDPEELLPVPEDGPSKAYEKFLGQYQALYENGPAASTPVVPESDTDAIVEPLPEPDVPVAEIPEPELIIEYPAKETPPVVEPDPVDENDGAAVVEPDPVDENDGAAAVEPDPVDENDGAAAVEPDPVDESDGAAAVEPDPVDGNDGAAAAIEELLNIQVLEQEPEVLDIVM